MLCPRVFSGKRRTNERTGIKVVVRESLSVESMSVLQGRSVGKMLAWVKIALQLDSLGLTLPNMKLSQTSPPA